MGSDVYVFTRTAANLGPAQRLRVTGVLEDYKATLEKHKGSFDFILSTIPEKHDINPYTWLLKRDKTMAVVGFLGPLPPIDNMQLILKRQGVAGSVIGSILETQEVLDFCAKHHIAPISK